MSLDTREARKARTQRAFTRRTQLAADRIVVMQTERAQEGLERQSLERQRAEDNSVWCSSKPNWNNYL